MVLGVREKAGGEAGEGWVRPRRAGVVVVVEGVVLVVEEGVPPRARSPWESTRMRLEMVGMAFCWVGMCVCVSSFVVVGGRWVMDR